MNLRIILFVGFNLLSILRGEKCDGFSCASGKCIPYENLCNHYNDCGDDEDETHKVCANCAEDEYTCDDGLTCVPMNSRCDGRNDCGDYSDESDCPGQVCQSYQFACRTTDRCIDKKGVCNNFNDCGDNSDEEEGLCGFNKTATGSESVTKPFQSEDTEMTTEDEINEEIQAQEEITVPLYVIALVTVVCFLFVVISIGISMAFISWKFKKMQKNQVSPFLQEPKSSDGNQVVQNANCYEYVDTKRNFPEMNSKLAETGEKRALPDIPAVKEYEDKYIYPENFYFMIDFDKEYINANEFS